MKQFSRVVLGGTFDRLHDGHKEFLRFAFEVSVNVVLGLMTDTYVRENKNISNSLSYEERKQELEEFLIKEGYMERVTIVPIEKNEIPQIWQSTLDAIVSTTDTLKGSETLNQEREKQGLPLLPIIPFPLVSGKDGKIISSSHIRQGIIDRTGNPYLTDEMQVHTFVLPKSLRSTLKKPLGSVIKTSQIPFKNLPEEYLVTVGDVTTSTFLKKSLRPTIGIIDFVVERKKKHSSIKDLGFKGTEQVYHLSNPKSQVRPEVFILLSHLFTSQKPAPSIIQITGEEDLIVLPVILLAPLETHIFYGQPGEGMVHVVVTEVLKKNMRDLLARFEKREAKPRH